MNNNGVAGRYAQPVARPDLVLSDAQLAARPHFHDEWDFNEPIEWFTSSLSALTHRGAFDKAVSEITSCLVQYRINCTDATRIKGLTLTEWLYTVDDSYLHLTLEDMLKKVRLLSDDELIPDDPTWTLWNVIEIQAIYHDQWVAIPYEWGIGRANILHDNHRDEVARRLLMPLTVEQLRAGQLHLRSLHHVTSPYIKLYCGRFNQVWRVGRRIFHVEPAKRIPVDHTGGVPPTEQEVIGKYEVPEKHQWSGKVLRPKKEPNTPNKMLVQGILRELQLMPREEDASQSEPCAS